MGDVMVATSGPFPAVYSNVSMLLMRGCGSGGRGGCLVLNAQVTYANYVTSSWIYFIWLAMKPRSRWPQVIANDYFPIMFLPCTGMSLLQQIITSVTVEKWNICFDKFCTSATLQLLWTPVFHTYSMKCRGHVNPIIGNTGFWVH